MHFIQLVLAVVFTFAATQSFAHGDHGNKACASYEPTCEKDPSVTAATGKAKWEAKKTCIKAAATADTANGGACLAAIAKPHK